MQSVFHTRHFCGGVCFLNHFASTFIGPSRSLLSNSVTFCLKEIAREDAYRLMWEHTHTHYIYMYVVSYI